MGFESGSQRVLDTINKSSTVEINLDAAGMAHEARLPIRGCFVIGMPGETREDVLPIRNGEERGRGRRGPARGYARSRE